MPKPAVGTDKILASVLEKINPTKEERRHTREILDLVEKETEKVLKPHKLEYTIAGSYIRDTWMRDKKEFDLFILFPEKTTRKELEEKGLSIGRQIVSSLKGSSRVAYAEHPYVRAKVKGYDVDIVPCYKLDNARKIKSAVDRTPFHNQWLGVHLKDELKPEVRLLKQFCKGQGLYGSDTKYQAFSGYLCELMVINYKKFGKAIQEASKWEPGKVLINPEGFGDEEMKEVHRKFKSQPLIVIDPVDPGRNVAAALSPENFMRFVWACKEFTAKPTPEAFFRSDKAVPAKDIEAAMKERGTVFIGVSFKAPDVIPDILWPQLKKTAGRVRDMLEENDFFVLNHAYWTDDTQTGVIVLEMEVPSLPKYRIMGGPSIFTDAHAAEFLKKYRPIGRVWVDGENWVAEVKREQTDAYSCLKALLKGTENSLHQRGIASHIAKQVARKPVFLKEREILSLARNNPEFSRVLMGMISKEIK